MNPTQHFLDWLTPARYELLNGLAFDRLAKRTGDRFARFMKGDKWMSMQQYGLFDYYPYLRLVGYLPPSDIWEPSTPLTAEEQSSDLRTWFTPHRRKLINRIEVDRQSKKPLGVLSRYLNAEPHITFKRAGIEAYYPVLEQLGFVPPEKR